MDRHFLNGVYTILPPKNGAGEGARTLDLNLGKVALYQLSYSRRAAPNQRPGAVLLFADKRKATRTSAREGMRPCQRFPALAEANVGTMKKRRRVTFVSRANAALLRFQEQLVSFYGMPRTR